MKIHRIALAHHYHLKPKQLSLNFTMQPLKLAVCLRMSYTGSVWRMPIILASLRIRRRLASLLLQLGAELRTVVGHYGCRFAAVFYGLLQHR